MTAPTTHRPAASKPKPRHRYARYAEAYAFLERMFDRGDLFELRALGIGPFNVKDKPGTTYTKVVAGHVTTASNGMFDKLADGIAYAMTGWKMFSPDYDGRHSEWVNVAGSDMAFESVGSWDSNAVKPLKDWGRPAGVYFTPNPLDPARVADRDTFGGWFAANERRKVSSGIPPATDDDVPARRWVVIDIDPDRPTDTPATDGERRAAFTLAEEVFGWLDARGWPAPVVVDSGNGVHGYWRFAAGDELPGGRVYDSKADPLARFLLAMQKQFAGRRAKVDAAVFNPARVFRLPGFLNRKGAESAGRPHRECRVTSDLDAPDVRLTRAVFDATLAEVAGHLFPPTSAAGGKRTGVGGGYSAQAPSAAAIKGAERYAAKMPPSVQGENGSAKLMAVARHVCWGFGCGEAEGVRVIMKAFNPRCAPEWHETDVAKKCRDVMRSGGLKPFGWKLAEGKPRTAKGKPTRPVSHPPSGAEYAADFAAEADEPEAAKSADVPRPQIVQKPVQLHEVVDQAVAALIKANKPPRDFTHGHTLIEMVPVSDERPSPVRAYGTDTLRYRLSLVADWFDKLVTEDGEEYRAAVPATVFVNSLLKRAADLGLPKLSGWSDAPVFAAEGRMVSAAGYDPESCYYILPSARPWDVPERPTAAQTRDAVNLFYDELLVDFPFTGEADRANALALYLLPFCRGMIDGSTPLHVVDAPEAGTGKTLFVTTWGEVAMGAELAGITQPESEAEWAKTLVATLRTAPRYVFLENVEDIGSKHLVAAITNRIHSGRQLGVSEMLTSAVRCVWLAAGNNITQNAETARRNCYIRLDADSEAPAQGRVFKHDLPGWATRERHSLVTAALTIIRSWVAAGRKPGGCKVGSFESWSHTMSGILAHAGVTGYMDNLNEVRTRHAGHDDGPELFRRLWERHSGGPFGVKDVLSIATEHELYGKELDKPTTDAGRKAVVRGLVKKLLGQVKGGRKLIEADPDSHNEVKRYRLLNLNKPKSDEHQPMAARGVFDDDLTL